LAAPETEPGILKIESKKDKRLPTAASCLFHWRSERLTATGNWLWATQYGTGYRLPATGYWPTGYLATGTTGDTPSRKSFVIRKV
jgi:hypothetical protein